MATVLLPGLASDPGVSSCCSDLRFIATSQVSRTPDRQVKYPILGILAVLGVFYHVMTSIPHVLGDSEVQIYLGSIPQPDGLGDLQSNHPWPPQSRVQWDHPLSSKHLDNADKGNCGLGAGSPFESRNYKVS